jgi:hypothetical protein
MKTVLGIEELVRLIQHLHAAIEMVSGFAGACGAGIRVATGKAGPLNSVGDAERPSVVTEERPCLARNLR